MLKDLEFFLRAQDEINARDSRDFCGSQLSVATSNYDVRVWRMPECPADHLTALSVSSIRHTARIYDADIGAIINTDDFIPLLAKLACNGRSFSEIQLASQSMYRDSPHRYEKELPDLCEQLFPLIFTRTKCSMIR
jgi:hypothetical protein